MNRTKTKNASLDSADGNRIYRLNRDGKWQKKTRNGTYVLMNPKQVLKRLQWLCHPCTRRIE